MNPEEDLTLNNGKTAKYLYTDEWGKQIYEIEGPATGKPVQICSVACDGTDLHTMTPDWMEPVAPLKEEYQPQ